MSQLQRMMPSVGQPDEEDAFTWQQFVEVVLRLTIDAFRAMNLQRVARLDWEENTFTINLEKFIRTIAFDNDLPIRVHSRTRLHTEEMIAGDQNTIEAKELDLCLYDIWTRDYHRIHFVWEAKRVGDKRTNGAYGRLNAEYVNEAIYRFIRGDYASNLPDAGILGYVLAGDVENIVNDINQTMGRLQVNPPLPPPNHLELAPAVNGFHDVYRSTHDRTANGAAVQLHHLFLSFDFP